ncbi:MAG: protein kinase domain-containing protein [Panacagrimonas sp.]
MSDKSDDELSTRPGPRSGGSGTKRADGPDIPSGFSETPAGTVRGGRPDIPSGFAHGQPGTVHGGSPDIPSGFGPVSGGLGTKLTRGDSLLINGVSYAFERVISKSTGEAEIFLLRHKAELCVFKLYYPNFKPKEEVLAQLKQLRHPDIINILDYGYFHDRFFEIMEYAEGGTLEQYLPIKDLQRFRAIVSETVNSFEFCHARGVVHRDIKPENIYCRNTDGSDIVIGDFGISSALDAGMSRRLTSQNLTAGYAAPEMYGFGGKVYIGREVDYYALGITLIHLWQGKSPFDGLTIHAIANLTNAGAINVPNDLPDALHTLIRGLITIDFTKRWGHGEVQRWLNGEDVPVHFHVKEITYPPFQFDAKEKASSPVALARLLKASPDRGKKLLYSGKISAWVNVFDHKLAAELDRIVEDEYPKSQDAGLQKTIYLLDPNEPCLIDGKDCRTAEQLATALDDSFSVSIDTLAKPNHPFYLYLEAHDEQKEADAFRAFFRTFSAKKALNTVILELAGRASISIRGQTFTSSESVLQAKDQVHLVNMLKDRESRLSMWMEGIASSLVNAQLEAWRAIKVSDPAALAYVSGIGDGVTRDGLIDLAKKAMLDPSYRELLQGVFDHELLSLHGRTADKPEEIKLHQDWQTLVKEYEQARQNAEQKGASGVRKLVDAQPDLLLALLQPSHLAGIRDRMKKAVSGGILECPWFAVLGAPDGASPAVSVLQDSLAGNALDQVNTERARLADEAAENNKIATWRSQRAQMIICGSLAYGILLGGLFALLNYWAGSDPSGVKLAGWQVLERTRLELSGGRHSIAFVCGATLIVLFVVLIKLAYVRTFSKLNKL